MADVKVSVEVQGTQEVIDQLKDIGKTAAKVGEEVKTVSAVPPSEEVTKLNEQIKESVQGIQQQTSELIKTSEVTSSLRESWRGFSEQVIAIAPKIAAVGATLGAVALKLGFSGMKDAAGLKLLSEQTGIAVESLSRLEYVSKVMDVPFQQLARSSATLQKNLVKPGAKFSEGLKNLGLDAKELLALKPEEQLSRIAESLSTISDSNEKLGNLQLLFGGAGMSLRPFFENGAQAIRETAKELDAFGGAISGETAEKSDAFFDNLTRIGEGLGALRKSLAADLAPMMLQLSGAFAGMLKNNGGLKALAIILGLLGKALLLAAKVVATVVVSVSAALDDVVVLLSGLGSAIKAIVSGNLVEGAKAIANALKLFGQNGKETTKILKDLWGMQEEANKSFEEGERKLNGLGKVAFNATRQMAGLVRVSNQFGSGGLVKTAGGVPSEEQWGDMMSEVRGFTRDFSAETARMLSDNTRSWREYIEEIGRMFSEMLIKRFIAKPLEEGLNAIFDALGKAVGGSIGGVLGGGGGGGGDAPQTTALARGGQLPAGYTGIVGEEGPELIAPSAFARRVTSNRSAGKGGSGSGPSIVQNFSFGSGVTREELAAVIPQIRNSAVLAIVDAQRRGAI